MRRASEGYSGCAPGKKAVSPPARDGGRGCHRSPCDDRTRRINGDAGDSAGLYLGGLGAPGFPAAAAGCSFVLCVLGGLELGRGRGGTEALGAAAVPFADRHPPADAGTAVLHDNGPESLPQPPSVQTGAGTAVLEPQVSDGASALHLSATQPRVT